VSNTICNFYAKLLAFSSADEELFSEMAIQDTKIGIDWFYFFSTFSAYFICIKVANGIGHMQKLLSFKVLFHVRVRQ
jgi:hypothetical protein